MCATPLAGIFTAIEIGDVPGAISSAEHVTVPFDCVQFQPLPDAERNCELAGSAIVATTPVALSYAKSVTLIVYVCEEPDAANAGATIVTPTSTMLCAKADAAQNERARGSARRICVSELRDASEEFLQRA